MNEDRLNRVVMTCGAVVVIASAAVISSCAVWVVVKLLRAVFA